MNHGSRDEKGKEVYSKGKADLLEFSWNKNWVKKKRQTLLYPPPFLVRINSANRSQPLCTLTEQMLKLNQ